MNKLKAIGKVCAVLAAMVMAFSMTTGCGDDTSSVSRATTTKSDSKNKDSSSESAKKNADNSESKSDNQSNDGNGNGGSDESKTDGGSNDGESQESKSDNGNTSGEQSENGSSSDDGGSNNNNNNNNNSNENNEDNGDEANNQFTQYDAEQVTISTAQDQMGEGDWRVMSSEDSEYAGIECWRIGVCDYSNAQSDTYYYYCGYGFCIAE